MVNRRRTCTVEQKSTSRKFNSKSEKIRAESAFYKHLMSSHGGKSDDKNFSEYFEIQILKAYKKPFTMVVEEGTYISNHKGELLNSKSEWHQAKIIRTTTQVIQGGVGGVGVIRDQPQDVRQGKDLGPVQNFFPFPTFPFHSKHACLNVFFLLVQKLPSYCQPKMFTSRSDQDMMSKQFSQ